MWEWLASIKGETWGAIAAGLVPFYLKVVGPAISRYRTAAYARRAQEIDALADNEVNDAAEMERHQLELDLALARHDLNAAALDQRRLANALAIAERERDAWKQRAQALAREAGLFKEDDNGPARRAPRGGVSHDRPTPVDRRMDHVRTIPPRKPDP